MSTKLLFSAGAAQSEQWAGPFPTIKALITDAYATRPEDDGVWICEGRPATKEERDMHGLYYTVSPHSSFMPWPPWIETIKRGCLGKQRYTKVEAQSACNAALRRKRNRPRALRAYHCTGCNGWHITKNVEEES